MQFETLEAKSTQVAERSPKLVQQSGLVKNLPEEGEDFGGMLLCPLIVAFATMMLITCPCVTVSIVETRASATGKIWEKFIVADKPCRRPAAQHTAPSAQQRLQLS